MIDRECKKSNVTYSALMSNSSKSSFLHAGKPRKANFLVVRPQKSYPSSELSGPFLFLYWSNVVFLKRVELLGKQ